MGVFRHCIKRYKSISSGVGLVSVMRLGHWWGFTIAEGAAAKTSVVVKDWLLLCG